MHQLVSVAIYRPARCYLFFQVRQPQKSIACSVHSKASFIADNRKLFIKYTSASFREMNLKYTIGMIESCIKIANRQEN